MKKLFSWMAIGLLVLALPLQISVMGYVPETEEQEGPPDEYGGSGTRGCYISTKLKCSAYSLGPLDLGGGERKICDFTGTYGSPITCTQTVCGDRSSSGSTKFTCKRG